MTASGGAIEMGPLLARLDGEAASNLQKVRFAPSHTAACDFLNVGHFRH
jgi:hypothetical protein